MGRVYSARGDQTPATNASILGITSATTVRPKIFDMVVSAYGTPEDKTAHLCLQRFTAAGTATSFTPIALDPGDPAALAAAGYNHTVEPTYTANAILYEFNLNQRGIHRWVAAPGGEFKLPATSANGAGLQFLAANATTDYFCTMMWEE